ncbi:MipA/OmpV family protein [Rhizobium sp. LjRoot30]|uniref:MipA/OmpV family protein n=1 Tax=Rhizobium sp. LjRoot30 TaxID=3342320 RepID=UPI003ECC6B5E
MFKSLPSFVCATVFLASTGVVSAQEGQAWWSGDWYVSIGAAGFVAPRFEGADSRKLQFSPLISIGKVGPAVRFSSRNDNPSFALLDNGGVRAGIAGKLITKRDEDTDSDLAGLAEVPWGLEAGAFVEVYPTDWIRARAELRHGIRSHHGVVADIAVDAFTDITPDLRLSGGPRATLASAKFFDAYYGVNAAESAKSGLSQYSPDGGVHSVGAGAALTWQASEAITTSSFVEYRRLTGPASDSSLVKERGSRDQLLFGLSATYKFGFTID